LNRRKGAVRGGSRELFEQEVVSYTSRRHGNIRGEVRELFEQEAGSY